MKFRVVRPPRLYARIRSYIVGGVHHVGFFGTLRSTDMAEITEALNGLVSAELCTVQLNSCDAIADLLHPCFTDFTRRCPTASWVVSEYLRPIVEGFGVPTDRIQVRPPARAVKRHELRRLPRLL